MVSFGTQRRLEPSGGNASPARISEVETPLPKGSSMRGPTCHATTPGLGPRMGFHTKSLSRTIMRLPLDPMELGRRAFRETRTPRLDPMHVGGAENWRMLIRFEATHCAGSAVA